jgi:hypothetical protein
MTNREIAQEISNRIGKSPVPFDSVYSIALQIYNELGGESTQFDSVYSILLEILPLVEGGVGGKAIETVDELPEASDNKDKFYRVEGEDGVYVAKLLSSETITTNKLPDEQQIDKAYLWLADDEPFHYKGTYKIICTDGVIEGYGWLETYSDNNNWYFILTKDNAVNVSTSSLGCYCSFDDLSSIDEVNKVIATEHSTDYFTFSEIQNQYEVIPIPATYNAPESAQIGNAMLHDTGEGDTEYVYKGEKEIVLDDGSVICYYWQNSYQDINHTYLTRIPASEILSDNGAYCIVPILKCNDEDIYIADDGKWTFNAADFDEYFESYSKLILNIVDGGDDLTIPQLNAPDSEQVGNATIKYNMGGNIFTATYDGTLATLYDSIKGISFTGYKWISTNSNEFITSVKAEDLYLSAGSFSFMWQDGAEVADAMERVTEVNLVKYQRTETTEEWGWEKVATEEYVDNAIDNIDIPEYVAGEGIAINSANTISCTVKPITNVSVLPDAEENKDSVLRLEGDKQVYISKGNPITPTNRVPDDEQISRAAISSDGGYNEYHGEYTITCADGVLHWYRWGDTSHFYITEDDAEHTIDSTKAFYIDTDDSKYSNVTESSITTTDNKSVIESSTVTVVTIDAGLSFPMPVTYKMPEETQIGNAFIESTNDDLFFYTGEEVDFEYLSRQYTGYKWVNVDRTTFEPNENLFKISLRKAEDLTYYDTGGDNVYCNTYIYTSNNGTVTEDYTQYIMNTINRNAADSEQVGNAYIYVNNISGGECYYTGEIATINGVSGYKWETSNHSDFIITVGVKAEDLYTNQLRLAKGEIPVYINSTSSEIDYSRLSDGYETVQYKRSVDYQWQRIVTEDELNALEARINALEGNTTVE